MKITRQNIINLIRGIIVIALAAAILITCTNVLVLKSEDGISQMKSFYKQPENSVDLVFMGSSKTYCVISTGVVWENTGISSFDLGGAEGPTWSTYYQMKEALKYQKPKVIAMELSTAALRPALEPPVFWVEDNAYGMKPGENRTNLLKANVSNWTYNKIKYPLGAMHQRYSELTADDFIDKNNSINYKGYDFRNGTPSYDEPDVSGVTSEGEISEKSREYLYKIIDLCRENQVNLWFFVTPYYIQPQEQEIYNYYTRICNEEGIPFVNFNDKEHIRAMGFDYSSDLADDYHLNIAGSVKFSKYLADMLQEKYDLPDHRGDAYYASWDVDARTLRMERADEMLRKLSQMEEVSDAEYLDVMNEDNYMLYITFGENVTRGAVPADVLASLVKLGVPIEQFVPGNALMIKNGTIMYAGATYEIEASIDNKYDSLLLKRIPSDDDDRSYETTLNINGSVYSFEDEGIEVYAYDMSNCTLAGSRHISLL